MAEGLEVKEFKKIGDRGRAPMRRQLSRDQRGI